MKKRSIPALLSAAVLGLVAVAGDAQAARPRPRALTLPTYAYVTSDGSPGEACEEACLKGVLAKVRGRRGVKKAVIEGNEIKLEIVPASFKAEAVIRDIVGMKIEMRLPYESIEIRFVPSAPFPPVGFLEEKALVVEMGEDVHQAIDAAVNFKLPMRMKCVGKASSDQANEAVLMRFEAEKRPPHAMIPFLAEADLDGDRRQDIYLRLVGLPEMVIFNQASGLKAVPVKKQAGGIDDIPRCEQSPLRFARPVPRRKIKCIDERSPAHSGDAIERVTHNRSNEMLMWSPKGFATCEPLGEGALPPATKTEDEEQAEE